MTKLIGFRPRDEAQKKLIEKYMDDNGLNQTQAMIKIIDKFFDTENRYEFLETNPCPLREYLSEDEASEGTRYGEGWYCMKKAPALTRLGSGKDTAADKICAKCKIKDETKDWMVQKNQDTFLEMPSCSNHGSRVNETLDRIYCPKIGKDRPIHIKDRKNKKDYISCNRAENGRPCLHLKFTKITIKALDLRDNK